MDAGEGGIADLPVEAAQFGEADSRVEEQRADRLQVTVVLAQPPQRLDTGDQAGRGVDEWLEAGDGLPVDQGTHP